MSLEECRAAMTFQDVWAALGLPDEKGRIRGLSGKAVKLCSPFRPDKSPGCSVYLGNDGRGRFKDFASGDCFDDVGIIAAAHNTSMKDAVRIFHELARVPMGGEGKKSRGLRPAAGPSVVREKTCQRVEMLRLKAKRRREF